jgi:UPF0755 protein
MLNHEDIDTQETREIPETVSAPTNNRTSYLFIALSTVLLLLVLISAFNLFVPVRTDEVIIRIKPGETTRTIAHKLKEGNIIRSSLWFDILARLTNSDRQLKAGRYVFGGNFNLIDTINRIKAGRSTLIHLTIPEGFSLYRTVRQMEKAGIAPYDTLMALATDPILVKQLTGFDKPTLEGFLYPETYAFDIDLKPEKMFAMMTNQFFQRVKAAGINYDDKEEFYRNLILASIVEQEAVREEEKPLIAGVFLNRLKKKMKLESCPTVDYTLERQGISRKSLTYEDLQLDTPYNTYKIEGLPPNPICNPSVSSLQAVIYPQISEFLYFFADFEGNNVFSKTYAEHINKQKQFQK